MEDHRWTIGVMVCSADDVKHLFVVLVWLGHASDCSCSNSNNLVATQECFSCCCVSSKPDGFEETLFHFGSCLTVGSKYCTVSPNSQSGALWSLFNLRKKLVLPSALMNLLT